MKGRLAFNDRLLSEVYHVIATKKIIPNLIQQKGTYWKISILSKGGYLSRT